MKHLVLLSVSLSFSPLDYQVHHSWLYHKVNGLYHLKSTWWNYTQNTRLRRNACRVCGLWATAKNEYWKKGSIYGLSRRLQWEYRWWQMCPFITGKVSILCSRLSQIGDLLRRMIKAWLPHTFESKSSSFVYLFAVNMKQWDFHRESFRLLCLHGTSSTPL